jgi:ATP-dependent Clp protease ATP-binding subunit ClpA
MSEFGARPLRRVIQQKVEDPPSGRVLAGEFVNGDAIKVNVNEDSEFVLDKAAENLPEPSL